MPKEATPLKLQIPESRLWRGSLMIVVGKVRLKAKLGTIVAMMKQWDEIKLTVSDFLGFLSR